ncbi:MAG TPA: hypothetical protein VGV07_09175 [Devosia sp.]|uniref:hypothetical protein n=1 Tax=Devosia sp. TaxID=1871048 RepID=UPI002DDD4C77|nr:hypothetical protein [Devosia sp.]HEV2515407.1 hypothetical protein [Devosia sp.]
MAKNPTIRILLLRSVVLGVLTVGSGALIYYLMGVSMLSAVLFALACGVASVVASFIS